MDRQTVIDLLHMQYEYDQLVFKAHSIGGYDKIADNALQSALIDECGELNHEVKKRWCWWKNSQGEEDMDKVKEELADVMHFIFMIINKQLSKDFKERKGSVTQNIGNQFFNLFALGFCEPVETEKGIIASYLRDLIGSQIHSPYHTGWTLHKLIAACGISDEEAVESYKAKNLVNRKRVQDGY